MKYCSYWEVTPARAVPIANLNTDAKEDFDISASIQDGTLSLELTGRFDTITAPKLLAFFKQVKTGHPVEAVVVDCSRLDYILARRINECPVLFV